MRNAIRHTPSGGKVWVRAHDRNSGELEIEIQDEGPGIAEEHLPKLFEPFYKTGSHKGHGLGLAIVRKAIELHGGKADAAPGKPGLLVSIRLSTF